MTEDRTLKKASRTIAKHLAAALIALPVAALPGTAHAQNVDVVGFGNSAAGREILTLVNATRASVGLGALTWDTGLEACAMQRAAEASIYFSHTRPNGTDWSTVTPAATARAENLASGQTTAAQVHADWVGSPAHCANIVNGSYVSFACAEFVADDGQTYWIELFSSAAGTGLTGNPFNERVLCHVEK